MVEDIFGGKLPDIMAADWLMQATPLHGCTK
jgi:hypothetical protein